jgi:hypothetical protein
MVLVKSGENRSSRTNNRGKWIQHRAAVFSLLLSFLKYGVSDHLVFGTNTASASA